MPYNVRHFTYIISSDYTCFAENTVIHRGITCPRSHGIAAGSKVHSFHPRILLSITVVKNATSGFFKAFIFRAYLQQILIVRHSSSISHPVVKGSI